ncbi:MAG: nicotinate-nucleotide--dimethylbenzimidazole phosphoribosyltransferase [Eubacteriales bacterium]
MITYQIKELNQEAMHQAKRNWDGIATPLNSLGKLEDVIVQCAGIFETDNVRIQKKAVVVMCADNGIVEEGVTQVGQVVTKIVAENMTTNKATVALMSKQCGADLFVVDIGMASDTENPDVINKKVMYGTKNFAKHWGMTREQVEAAIQVGIHMVKQLKELEYDVIATGEMGIGNTTTSSAIASCILNQDPEIVTGKGAGLSSSGLLRKIQLIQEALEMHKPNREDGIDVLAKVGGLDIAGMCGMFLGGAIYRVPILIDGFISATAALVAQTIDIRTKAFMIPTHVSAEPAGEMLLEALGLEPMLSLNMCLGEGTGAVMAFPILDTASLIYNEMCDFQTIEIDAYEALD